MQNRPFCSVKQGFLGLKTRLFAMQNSLYCFSLELSLQKQKLSKVIFKRCYKLTKTFVSFAHYYYFCTNNCRKVCRNYTFLHLKE